MDLRDNAIDSRGAFALAPVLAFGLRAVVLAGNCLNAPTDGGHRLDPLLVIPGSWNLLSKLLFRLYRRRLLRLRFHLEALPKIYMN